MGECVLVVLDDVLAWGLVLLVLVWVYCWLVVYCWVVFGGGFYFIVDEFCGFVYFE